jgi:GNAT superfamily N-acetyltransferase
VREDLIVVVRPIAVTDAEAAAKLSGELGYPASAETMKVRIRNLDHLRDHAVFVACSENSVVGWIDVGIVHHLHAEPYGEIGGLVVANEFRSAGIGRMLVIRAEQFTRDRGIAKMLVRSQIKREAAHRFYLRDGYERTKTSAVFTKALSKEETGWTAG